MSETTVSATVAFLFGGMIFLLAYTRLGGMPTVLLALAILVGYIVLEMWHAWRGMRRERLDRQVAEWRWVGWELDDRYRPRREILDRIIRETHEHARRYRRLRR